MTRPYIDERNKTFPNKCGHYYSEVSGLFISLTNETHRHNMSYDTRERSNFVFGCFLRQPVQAPIFPEVYNIHKEIVRKSHIPFLNALPIPE